MDNKIYRLKKRTVHPENFALDEVTKMDVENIRKSTLHRNTWCGVPLEETSFTVLNNFRQAANGECVDELIDLEDVEDTNTQFIQKRMHDLVCAFSNRTDNTRKKIELPATPSSISSRETIPKSLSFISTKTTNLESISEKWWDDGRNPNLPEFPGGNIFSYLIHIYNTWVIDPQGKYYMVWMLVATLAILYNVWVIPLRSSFPYQTSSNRAIWMFFDYTSDLIYVIDILFVQTRIMYLREGFFVSEYRLTRLHYLKKINFKLDVISMLPLDLLYFYYGPEKVILRFPRFFKLHTFWAFFEMVDKLIASPHIVRISRTLIYMMYLIHVNACAYYAFSSWEGIGNNNFVYNGKGNAYIVCFYFATKTATSIGKNPKPTQELEYMFMTFSWLMGVFVFALLIGQIRDIIATATKTRSEYRKLIDETLEYMRRLNLPQDMQRRVQLWFNYTWKTQRTLDENTILDCLPHKTKTDIAIHVHIKTLSKVKLFADCDEALLRELVLQLKSVIYLPRDIICKKGDVGKDMYIVQSGKVQVIGRNEVEVLATLSEGSVFGEISLLGISGMNRRTADVRSQGYSNLFVLSKCDLNEALKHYPEAQKLLNKKAKQLMKQNEELERKNDAVIIIDNPKNPEPEPKLLTAVLQVVEPDSNVDRMLRYGSKTKLKFNKNHNQNRSSSPDTPESQRGTTFETKVTVHRSCS